MNDDQRRGTMARKVMIGAVLAAAVGGGAWVAIAQPWKKPAPVTAQQLAAELELAAGEVLLEGATARRLLSGTPLPQGAVLRTGTGARALIRLQDGARLYLDEGTRVELGDQVTLHEGRAWLDAPGVDDDREPAAHRLGSSTVTLSEGGASLTLRDGTAIVYVAEGLAVVAGPGGRSEVAAGEQAEIAADAAPKVAAVAFWDDWTGGMGDRSGLGGSIASGSGSLYAVDRSAAAGAPALPLSIQNQSVKVTVRDDLAETLVDQVFFNPSGRDVEGYYWFSVPEGAALVGFALETNGVLVVEAEIVERQQAAATYEAAIRRATDPALLEWIDDRTVRARIFPVPALGTRRTVVRYQQLLTESEGKVRYGYPLAGPAGKGAPTIEEFSLAVDLGELGERYDIATLAEARVEDGGKRVTMRRSGYTPRADFQLQLSRKPDIERAPLRMSLLDPGADQARYVMVRYSPDLAFDEVATPKGQVVVVLDTSAAGDPAEYQTRLAVTEALLRSLSAGDEFVVMSADVRAEVLYPDSGLAPAGTESVSAALERLAEHGTGGATDLGAVFELALERVHGLEQPAVVYVGDGMATSGERGGDALAERLRRSMTGSRARLFTVGVGQEVDDRLLQALARIGGGTSLRVDSPEQAIVRALELSGALKTPTITDLEIDLGEGLDDVFTNTTGKLSRGQELVLLARTHHDLPKEVKISGRLGGAAFERTHELEPTEGVLGSVVPRLWAGAYIERLLGDSRGPEAVRGKILSLGLEYGLMSPHTSFLALDSEQAYAAMGVQRRARRLGGVRLVADASHAIEAAREREEEEDGALGVVASFFSAPIGCGVASQEASAPQRGDDAAKSKGTVAASGVVAERKSESAPEAPPPPANRIPEVKPEPTVVDAAMAADEPASASAPAMDPSPGGGGKAMVAGRDKGGDDDVSRNAGDRGRLMNEEEAEEGEMAKTPAPEVTTQSEKDGKAREQLRWRAPQRPCSDASARSLSHRRALWQTRLAAQTTMSGALGVYEASSATCELATWKDQRTLLRLLQERADTEADIGTLLAHFHDDGDAIRYLARALLRRVVDPALVAAVDNALFGSTINWAEVDRKIVLATDVEAKLELVRDALERSPGDPAGELRLIELLAGSGRLAEAVTRGRALRDQGLMTPALAQALGEVMVAHGEIEPAKRMFSEIVEFDPESAVSRRLLGDIFLRHGWYDAAYRQYEDLVAATAQDEAAPIRLARAAAGTGRTDEALRTLRKIAAGEGRPGIDDPRRFARLHAAALLASLLRTATEGSDIPPASVARELRRLQLFDGPTTWTLLRWEDLQAQLVLTHADPQSAEHLGDAVTAGDTGLYALQSPAAGAPPLTVRHAGELLDRPVTFTRTTIRFDGSKFTVEEESGTIPARRSRLLEPPPEEPKAEEAVATAPETPDGKAVEPEKPASP